MYGIDCWVVSKRQTRQMHVIEQYDIRVQDDVKVQSHRHTRSLPHHLEG